MAKRITIPPPWKTEEEKIICSIGIGILCNTNALYSRLISHRRVHTSDTYHICVGDVEFYYDNDWLSLIPTYNSKLADSYGFVAACINIGKLQISYADDDRMMAKVLENSPNLTDISCHSYKKRAVDLVIKYMQNSVNVVSLTIYATCVDVRGLDTISSTHHMHTFQLSCIDLTNVNCIISYLSKRTFGNVHLDVPHINKIIAGVINTNFTAHTFSIEDYDSSLDPLLPQIDNLVMKHATDMAANFWKNNLCSLEIEREMGDYNAGALLSWLHTNTNLTTLHLQNMDSINAADDINITALIA